MGGKYTTSHLSKNLSKRDLHPRRQATPNTNRQMLYKDSQIEPPTDRAKQLDVKGISEINADSNDTAAIEPRKTYEFK